MFDRYGSNNVITLLNENYGEYSTMCNLGWTLLPTSLFTLKTNQELHQ